MSQEARSDGAIAPSVRRVVLGNDWLAVHERGEGEPVVLLHSGGFSARQWRKLGDALSNTHRVLAPDLLGYGASSPWPVGAPFHLRQDLAALEAMLDSVPAPAHLVGHSYGGLLALKLALSRPRQVRSLALFEPVAFAVLDEPSDADARASIHLVQHDYRAGAEGADDAWLGAFVDWWNGPGAWTSLAEDARASFRAVGWKVFQEVLSIGADATPRATFATIGAPTLLLSGERTPATERRVVEKLAATLPHAELKVFAEMGHMGPITHAAIVNGAIAAHIRASSTPRTLPAP
jgi:pimeloyl-ACP methyl ester carboxylesterase